MQDNFLFFLSSGFKGYNSTIDRTILEAPYLVRGSKNVYKKDSNTISVRFGLKRRGSADSTNAGVKSSYEWSTSLGATRVLRVCNGKLQVESDILIAETYVWYDLMTGLSLDRFVFDTWWNDGLKKDELIFVKGDNNLQMWQGGIGVLSSTTMTTIVLTDSIALQGFSTGTGTVLVNGNSYAYTGSSGSMFTGVSPDPSGEAVNSVVISGITTTATSPDSSFINDFIKTINNRLHVGSYTSRLIYISSQDDYTNFTVPATRVPGDPELLTLDNTGKGISVRNGNAHIFAGTSDLYEITYTPITVGAVLTEQTKVDKKPTAFLSAALAHEFIDNVGNDVVYLAQDQQVRVVGTFRNLNQTKYPSLSQAVRTEFGEEDFTGGHLRCIGDFIRISAPVNGRDWYHESKESIDAQGNIVSDKMWHPPQVRNISRFAVIDGIEYGHSNANPQIYQIDDTEQWHDDSPADEALSYTCTMRISYRNNGGDKRSSLVNFDKVFYEGYMTQGTILYGNVYDDYQGATDFSNYEINSNSKPAKFFIASNAPSLGTSSLGDNPLGDGLTPEANDQELLPKFRAIRTVAIKDCFEYELEVYSLDADSRWEMLCMGVNAKQSVNQPMFLIK